MDIPIKFIEAIVKKHFNLDSNSYKALRMDSGFTNFVYKIETNNKENYIIKIFKNKFRGNEKEIFKKTEIPKIIFICDNYTIEEFIVFKTVNFSKDMYLILRSLKKFHKTKFDTSLKKFDVFYEIFLKNDKLLWDIYNRFKVERDNSVLMHFDLQEGNILKIEDSIHFIDFEYSSIGPPELDLANLLEETITIYENNVFYAKDKILTDEKIIDCIKIYFSEELRDLENKNEFYKEKLFKIKYLRYFNNFFHFLWAKNNLSNNNGSGKNSFDYKKFANLKIKTLLNANIISDEEYNQILLQ